MRHTAAVLPLILAVAASTASDCERSQDRSRGSSEISIRQEAHVVTKSGTADAIQSVVVRQTEDNGIDLARKPYCRSEVTIAANDRSASGKVTCIGHTEDRDRVVATFEGVVSLNSCDGSLTVTVDEREVMSTTRLSNCGIASD